MSRLFNRVGRRGLYLAFLSMLDVIIGYFLLTSPEIRSQYPILPQMAWGIIWIVVGAICATGIFVRRDAIQFAAAALLKAVWSVRYVYLWYLGYPSQWAGLMIWLAFASITLVVAGWPEVSWVKHVD